MEQNIAIPLRIVIVEDNLDDAELTRIELRKTNLNIEWIHIVENKKEYLSEIKNNPSIILSDYEMPSFTGMDALHCLQEEKLDIPFIIITGTGNEEIAVECMKEGAADYILKRHLMKLETSILHALINKHTEKQLLQAQKMELIGTLAGGFAHDFNNVLTGIIGIISLLEHKFKNKEVIKASEVTKYLSILMESSQRATSMVLELLSLSKEKSRNFEFIDIIERIENVIKICKNSFDKIISINTIFNDKNAVISGNATQIEQVILNLLINARDAMPDGGTISIFLKSKNAEDLINIIKEELPEKKYWCLTIQDNGKGMDNKVISRIFDPFYTTKEKGTGLGLTMVYNIIKQHNGFIDVYSEKMVGTVFNIYFPVSCEETHTKKTLEEQISYKGSGTILIIDDEKIIRNIAEEILINAGYSVLTAENGVEAIEIYKKHFPDIKAVLLDFIMPQQSAKATYIELKKINPEVEVILTSGFKPDEKIDSLLKLGIQVYLQKPYSVTKLTKVLHVLLNNTTGHQS
jgi:signal transduction histidine kinase